MSNSANLFERFCVFDFFDFLTSLQKVKKYVFAGVLLLFHFFVASESKTVYLQGFLLFAGSPLRGCPAPRPRPAPSRVALNAI